MRLLILQLPYPLGADPATTKEKLVLEVDFLTTGLLKGSGKAGILLKAGREAKIIQFIDLLPIYFHHRVSEELAQLCFSRSSLVDTDNKATFHLNDEGNWDGTWDSRDSSTYAGFASDGSTGTGFDLSALKARGNTPVTLASRRMIFDPDDASTRSFKTAVNDMAPDAESLPETDADGGLPTIRNKESGGGSPTPTNSEEATSGSPAQEGESGGGSG